MIEVHTRKTNSEMTSIPVDTSESARELLGSKSNVTDVELAHAVLRDISRIEDWEFDVEIKKEPLESIFDMMSVVECENTLHGIRILKKMLCIDNFKLTARQAVPIILHDVVKYRSRPEVIKIVMEYTFGKGRFVRLGNHGVHAGLLISEIFEIHIQDLWYIFNHAKDNPFLMDSSALSLFEMAFFVIDDLIKGVDKYKRKLQRQEYAKLNKFIQSPKHNDILAVYEIIRTYKLSKHVKGDRGECAQ